MKVKLYEMQDGNYEPRPLKIHARNVKMDLDVNQDPRDNLQNKIEQLYNARHIDWYSVVNGYNLPNDFDPTQPFCHWQEVAYGDGVWVAVGSAYHGAHEVAATSHIMYSTNGTDWTMVSGMDKDYYYVEYNAVESKFLALTMDGTYKAISSDGINWTQSPLTLPSGITDTSLNILRCYNGVFYALFSYSTSKYIYSSNGAEWSIVDIGASKADIFTDILVSNKGDTYLFAQHGHCECKQDGTSTWLRVSIPDANAYTVSNGYVDGHSIILILGYGATQSICMTFDEDAHDEFAQRYLLTTTLTTIRPYKIIYDSYAKRFMMIEKEQKNWSNDATRIIYISQNGIAWYRIGVSDSAHWSGIAADGAGHYVLVSQYGLFNQFVAPYKTEQIPSGIFSYGRIREYV